MKKQKPESAFLLISRKAKVPNQESQPDHALQQKVNRLYLQDITTCKQITLCTDFDGTSTGTILLLDQIIKEINRLKKEKIIVTDIVFPTLCRIGRNFTTVDFFQSHMKKRSINIHVAEPYPVPPKKMQEYFIAINPKKY